MIESLSGFRGRIHRGTRQIGGTCVELEACGARILLDLGLPLDAAEVSDTLLPDVAGLRSPDPSLQAIVMVTVVVLPAIFTLGPTRAKVNASGARRW